MTSIPPLTLTFDNRGDTAIVHLHGRLVAGCGERLYAPVVALFSTHQRIVLDLRELTHMDSLGIGQLLRVYASAKSHHRQLELKNLGNRIRELMIMTNLLPVFSIVGEHNLKM